MSAPARGTGPVLRPRNRNSNAGICRHPAPGTSCRFACVPWLVCRTGLHRREDAHQTRLLASLCDDLFHPIFLPEVPFADELDFDASLRRHLLRVLANAVPVRLGELRIIEDPNLPLKQQRRHSPVKTDTRQGAENPHAVKATQHSLNLSSNPGKQNPNALLKW